MTGKEECKLWTVRFFINFFVVLCLGGAGYLLYYVTQVSVEVKYCTTCYTYMYLIPSDHHNTVAPVTDSKDSLYEGLVHILGAQGAGLICWTLRVHEADKGIIFTIS